MASMTFFGFLNEDDSVTRVFTQNEIVLPIKLPVWGKGGIPQKISFTKLTNVTVEKSVLSGRKWGDLTILGLFDYLFILVDTNGLCYSVDCDNNSSTS